MSNTGIIGLILIIANIIFSYRGFVREPFFDKYKFEVDKILIDKDYKRLITSGFLHVSWMHLLFNMLSLYLFSGPIESSLGGTKFLIIYFASLLGGELLSLLVHRNHGDYSSVGASGAICGIIFASIALFPGLSIGFFILPVSIPGWLYGILYVGLSIYAIKSKRDNIGHEAHLGGALVGMAVMILIEPSVFINNYLAILIITVPTIIFIYFIITKPRILLVDNFYFKHHNNYYSLDDKYNLERNSRQQEVDKILEKISRKGIKSLNKKERQILNEYSQTVR